MLLSIFNLIILGEKGDSHRPPDAHELALKGARGPPGEAGDRGDTGQPGIFLNIF